ncbi:MAG TPA: flagellar hook-length control protein FliK [Acetobacteraceae bacterium]|nr:flagellar hook-length control protein FliK [Acetobacteraceae bacterium]
MPQAATNARASGASPAAQVAPALFSLARSGTSNVLTLRLEPATLGQVEVEITRPPDGPAAVKVTAEQPDTLLLLLRDQPALQQALDRAGLTLDPRSVSFHLAPSQSTASQSAAQVAAAPVAAAEAMGFSGGSGLAAGGASTGDPEARRARTAARQAGAQAEDAAISLGTLPGSAWLRAGLDITA